MAIQNITKIWLTYSTNTIKASVKKVLSKAWQNGLN